MSKSRKGRAPVVYSPARVQRPVGPKTVPSLLDEMQDGNEYGSIVSLVPQNPDIVPELRRAIGEIEQIRGRPCVVYVANLIKDVTDTAIHAADHLPFCEMVGRIATTERKLDIFIATPGGSAEQVNLFVEAVRPRFDAVDFLVPYKAMSAGTLWALSERAMRRLWALAYYTCDKLPAVKMMVSGNYSFVRSQISLMVPR